MKTIKTVCQRDCPDTCFIDATVDEGIFVSTRASAENPVTQGFLCPRGKGDPKRVYSPKRVLVPHERVGARSGAFEKTTWDAALKRLATQLKHTIERYGNESVLLYDYPGNQGLLAWQYPRRLWHALGATMTDYSLCSNSGHAGIGLHYGHTCGLQPEDLARMKTIVFWGNNARTSSSHQWAFAIEAQKKSGASLIAVDPRRSETAEASDLWLSIRPGGDVALAYALANYLNQRGAIKHDFLKRFATGYEEFLEEAKRWTEGRTLEYTGIGRNRIEELGDLLIDGDPVAFMIGLGLQKSAQGAEAARAVSLLPTLLGHHRGFHYSNSRGREIDWGHICGSDLSTQKSRTVNQASIGPRIQSGEFKFVFIFGSNPASTLPHQSAVRKGLSRADVFVAVHDTHWTETTEHADVVLPAATYLEKEDICLSDHHIYVRISNKVIEPRGESRGEIDVMNELSHRLDLKEDWLATDPWKTLEAALADAFVDGSLGDLRAGSVLKLREPPIDQYQTPSGRIEFRSSSAVEQGHRPLPQQTPLFKSPDTFILLNSSLPKYLHSQFTDVYGPMPQIVWIHHDDAASRSIEDGDIVRLFNEHGSLSLRALVTGKVSPGCLWVPRPVTGLSGNPLNVLAPSSSQTIGGGPVFNSIEVRISKETPAQ